ncbi:hypothetical protein [Actinomadura rubrisoli]|uniref:Uncharacterized protein n=1 Tax=Actinomadura rubrisoli TaxID=2530368 RepID=A0A4R5CFM7_9ACTN|nr:hypothetical protein [Actinomadura rubrisoli]TDD96042.1 hypothetical protein E1298_03610 [Actinomadura rubrisoli]
MRHALSTPGQLTMDAVLQPGSCPMGLQVTLADATGAGALPLFARTLDEGHVGASEHRRLLNVIALLPRDAAFQALIDRSDEKYVQPVLIAAMTRSPARALRLLVPAAARSKTAAALLADHVRAHPETTAAMLPRARFRDTPDRRGGRPVHRADTRGGPGRAADATGRAALGPQAESGETGRHHRADPT